MNCDSFSWVKYEICRYAKFFESLFQHKTYFILPSQKMKTGDFNRVFLHYSGKNFESVYFTLTQYTGQYIEAAAAKRTVL